MALKFTRLVVNCGLFGVRLIHQNTKSIYHLAKFKNPQTIIFTFFALPFGKKEDNKEMASSSEDFKTQLEKADQLFDDNKFEETVTLLKSFDQTNSDVLWRLGRALFKVSGGETNSSRKAEIIREAFKAISESLEKDESNYAVHKWYAILLDAKSNLDGIKERVTQLENVKKHMMLAVDLNPEDPTSRYILGEFAFGLADLPWYQRKIVSTIFATPPTGDYTEALENFLKAESLEPNFYSMNLLMIGKCYYQLKNTEKAKEFLTKAASIVAANEDDRTCKQEAEALLKKIK